MIFTTFFAVRTLPAVLLTVVLLATGTPALAAGAPLKKIDTNLEERMAVDEWVKALVMMRDQVDTKALERISPYRNVRHEVIVSSLQTTARQSQADIVKMLDEAVRLNTVKRYRTAWITNLVAVEARPEVITQLAERVDVEMV